MVGRRDLLRWLSSSWLAAWLGLRADAREKPPKPSPTPSATDTPTPSDSPTPTEPTPTDTEPPPDLSVYIDDYEDSYA